MIEADDEAAFPRDPWAIIPADATERLEFGMARLLRHYAAPRDETLARRFLAESLPTGRLCLYGAGSMSVQLLGWLGGNDGIEIVGIIDRNAATLQHFHDLPVIPPTDLSAIGCDYVLVAHPLHEMDMMETLLDAGLTADRLFPLYDNPAFADRALPPHRARIAASLPTGCRYCIVGSSHLNTIRDDVLSRLFPTDDTVLLHFSPYEKFRPSPIYSTVDTASSTTLLAETLHQLAPDVVVLRSTCQLSFLAGLIKTALPNTILIHDFYDFANLLPRSLLQGWMAMSDEQVSISQLAEYQSLRTCDVAISKRDGRWWGRMLAPTTKPFISYFSGSTTELQPHARAAKRDGDPWRVLYAGVMLQAKPGEYKGDYNFLPLFEALSATGHFDFELYNGAHRDAAQDQAYQYFMERYPAAPMHYHRRAPYPELHATAHSCHFGWLYRDAGGEVSYDAATGIPARCLGYLNAGLPVIVDDKWGYLEDLIDRHHAGIILPQGEGARLPEILAACDFERLQAGAVLLLRFFLEHNESAFARLHHYLRDERGLSALPPLVARQIAQ